MKVRDDHSLNPHRTRHDFSDGINVNRNMGVLEDLVNLSCSKTLRERKVHGSEYHYQES